MIAHYCNGGRQGRVYRSEQRAATSEKTSPSYRNRLKIVEKYAKKNFFKSGW